MYINKITSYLPYPEWYLTGGTGDMSPSLDFGVPLTGIDSVIPGWDAFNPSP